MQLTQEYLKSILAYDPETGIFIRKTSPSNRVKIGDIAGSPNSKGYLQIMLKNKLYKSHRLAWLYIYGDFPKADVDHINHDKADNRIINLREATKSENLQNQIKKQSGNKSGYLGVCFHKKSKKYSATISINRKQWHLGLFPTPEEAHEAYLKAKRQIHEFGTL